MSSAAATHSPIFRPGVSLLPEDFPDRLMALKELTGLSWEGLAVCLGVDVRQLQHWREGGWPNGGAMLSLVDFAIEVPGGLGVLLDRDVTVIRTGRG
jgi:hypothetical protein